MAMNDKTKRVFNGWLALSADERRELQANMKEYLEGTATFQESLRKSTSISLGPVGGGCPCCGR